MSKTRGMGDVEESLGKKLRKDLIVVLYILYSSIVANALTRANTTSMNPPTPLRFWNVLR